ncbi:MAG TPA: Gfo/Idh/MocA family oxidoreductase [Burkholderiales bacterium]|nr:Gfo/Idh/MocA family oxidoreductase [Burkholderiales bacterium]
MINAAIVGLGRWGQNLVNSVQGKSDKIRFVAGVLRHPENAREYAERQGIALQRDLDKVLEDPRIDAIVLATPHTVHGEQILAAVNAGKPVFTEKPFTLTSRDAARALRAAERKNVTVGVGYNWRFQPALQEIRRMLEDGRLGKLLHIEGNFCGPSVYRFKKEHWRQKREEGPAGGMTGRGVHVVDAMLYLAGKIDTVHAQSHRIALDYGIDDTTSMLFRFASGATGYLSTIIATAETWRMQIFGSRGWVEVGDVEHLTTWQMRVCYVDPENLNTHQKPQVMVFPQTSTERAELENFADAVADRRPLAIAGGDEEHGVAVLEAILESAKLGEPVKMGAAQGAERERAGSAGTSSVAVKTKRLLKSVKKTLRKVVKETTRVVQKKKPRTRSAKRPSTAARRAAARKPVRRARRR